MRQKNIIQEVCLISLVLIVALVLYHSFAPLVRLFRFLYPWTGIVSLTLLSIDIIDDKTINLSPFWIKISTYTFGIYLFQQFILVGLYYHIRMIHYVPMCLLTWIAFGMILILSFLLTMLLRNFKSGRWLIG